MLYRDLDIDQLICLTFDLVQIIFKKVHSSAFFEFLKISKFQPRRNFYGMKFLDN